MEVCRLTHLQRIAACAVVRYKARPMTRKSIYAFSKRAFLNPSSTRQTSYIQAHVQTGQDGPDRWGDNMVIIADCKRVIQLEFFLGSKRDRRISLAKIDLLIKVLTKFRTALAREISLIEGEKSALATKSTKVIP
jgi:hypothetical protein